eukprot:7144958-Prymnesium_polylepis.1
MIFYESAYAAPRDPPMRDPCLCDPPMPMPMRPCETHACVTRRLNGCIPAGSGHPVSGMWHPCCGAPVSPLWAGHPVRGAPV